jgi:hypothetical protein
MNNSCPISPEVIDERAARVVALLVLPLLSSALLLGAPWIAVLLAADFGLRGFGLRRLSPLGGFARLVLGALGTKAIKVNAGPKQFAAKIGLVFSLLVATGLAAGLPIAAWTVGAGLGVCAALEGFFGLCVGCRIYRLLPRPETQPERPTA